MAVATVVQVHGVFADGSSLAKAIPRLTARGPKAAAVQNPLSLLDIRETVIACVTEEIAGRTFETLSDKCDTAPMGLPKIRATQ